MLGYFVVAVDDVEPDAPITYVDPWGGRGVVEPTSVRVLRDTEVIAAALGTEAVRIFASSGDGAKALPMVERALSLDPRSPTLRIAHATILIESGGTTQALEELRAAVELRPDGPRKLHQAQLTLAEGAMLEANGQAAGAAERFADANRIVVDVLERWPRYGRAHLTMATVHLGLGDRERALYALERAESSSPDSPMLWAAWAEYDLGDDDPEAALSKMRRAVRIDPENWQLRVQAAIVAARSGAETEARAHADEALRRVATSRRPQVREYLDRVLGDAPPSIPAGATTGPDEPALMLGDPSNLRLRGSDSQLELDPDLRLELEE
jgi:tetratricopeptide (TPR) repeat protein